jgi:hypothetical protein
LRNYEREKEPLISSSSNLGSNFCLMGVLGWPPLPPQGERAGARTEQRANKAAAERKDRLWSRWAKVKYVTREAIDSQTLVLLLLWAGLELAPSRIYLFRLRFRFILVLSLHANGKK